MIGKGHGFVCQVARVYLEYDAPDPDAPRTVIAKLPTPIRKNRSNVEAAQGYEREVCREGALLDAYCEELLAQGVEGYSRKECERDYTLGKFFQAYLHTSSDDFIDLSEGRARRLIEVMRERLYARLPEPPYDGLL